MLTHHVPAKRTARPLSLKLARWGIQNLQIGLNQATTDLCVGSVHRLFDGLPLIEQFHEFTHLRGIEIDEAGTDTDPSAKPLPSGCELRSKTGHVIDHSDGQFAATGVFFGEAGFHCVHAQSQTWRR